MSDQHAEFRHRLRRLDRKSLQMSQGYTAKMRADGLIIVEPRKVVRSKITLRSLILFLTAILVFKGFLIASLGYSSYDERVQKLSRGTAVEQGGAFLMQADPISTAIASHLVPYLR
ncbi:MULTISPECIES: hypothetical protein [unclassified Epibacterium]|uniref:hypothetical protein n=1 Tax=unclassified Epibacterium TaxID=2639179 RepID=UPI001EF60D1C|nr:MULTISPECIES: hypothetical protein [unclassified Epibacterium]MCG7625676.1 hypothetical protein [Epibacterium sp. Ofav1-8]MCG7628051.1 hypothetical protein [Epibacterium sp. MM17-32]